MLTLSLDVTLEEYKFSGYVLVVPLITLKEQV